MLAGRRVPRLERYLLRGRFDVDLTYQCAVSRRTSTRGARDEELGVPENEGGDQAKCNPVRKNKTKFAQDESFRSLLTTRRDAGSRTEAARFSLAAHETGLPIDRCKAVSVA